MKIAIVGCGDIGIRAARLLIQQGHDVIGVRRDISKLPDWLDGVAADVSDRESLECLSERSLDVVFYVLAAGAFSESAYQQAYVTGVSNTLDALATRSLTRFIFVSSTSVYHQNDGATVDEDSPTNPVNFNGQLMLSGEKLVLGTKTGTVVRFSGIYGPARTRMIDRVRQQIRGDADDENYTNRIHVDDCAGVLAHLVTLAEKDKIEALYLASDSKPGTRYELEQFIATELELPDRVSGPGDNTQPNQPNQPKQTERAEKSAGKPKRIAGSKRCSNARLLKSGYRFLYPDYRSGYRQVLSTLKKQ